MPPRDRQTPDQDRKKPTSVAWKIYPPPSSGKAAFMVPDLLEFLQEHGLSYGQCPLKIKAPAGYDGYTCEKVLI
ncbi:hypothetical protein [Deinococcus kurensis]|uniref:hypothetical protein n=1 Tax=Deinococcus kurensis TaxID=2662757 RepID=UPI0012D320C9|nr:hypothetical protein [Deinococcus kurensis]